MKYRIMLHLIVFFAILATSSSQVAKPQKYECGRVTPAADSLVIGGERARHGELPWHVGVYQKTSRPYRQICGGSIVSRKLVISAAHCFWNTIDKLTPASRYSVAAGKIYKPWDEPQDRDAQFSNVSDLVVPPLFRGVDRNFAEDLALLLLDRPFEYRPYLRPVCLDFDPLLEERQLRAGNIGKVAGWGLVSATGTQTTVLNVASLPVMDTAQCLEKSPKNYWEYITADKICAGVNNGNTTLCQGDSGGGLVFAYTRAPGDERYFLRGVVSTSPSSSTVCNAFAIASFTRLSVHRRFIEAHYKRDTDEEPLPLNINNSPTGVCILPGHPKNGQWVANWKDRVFRDAKPGDTYGAVRLNYTCTEDPRASASVSCIAGLWQNRTPRCPPPGRGRAITDAANQPQNFQPIPAKCPDGDCSGNGLASNRNMQPPGTDDADPIIIKNQPSQRRSFSSTGAEGAYLPAALEQQRDARRAEGALLPAALDQQRDARIRQGMTRKQQLLDHEEYRTMVRAEFIAQQAALNQQRDAIIRQRAFNNRMTPEQQLRYDEEDRRARYELNNQIRNFNEAAFRTQGGGLRAQEVFGSNSQDEFNDRIGGRGNFNNGFSPPVGFNVPSSTNEFRSSSVNCVNGMCSEQQEETVCVDGQCSGGSGGSLPFGF